jgi:O-antigen/teichoic acid export membrane protein
LITVLANLVLIPLIGYTGSALASVACYGTMSVICWLWGRKYLPIPYQWEKIVAHLLLGIGLIFLTGRIRGENEIINLTINILIPILYITLAILLEKKKSGLKII